MAEKEWRAKYEKDDHREELDKKVNDLKVEWEEVKRQELEQRLEEVTMALSSLATYSKYKGGGEQKTTQRNTLKRTT